MIARNFLVARVNVFKATSGNKGDFIKGYRGVPQTVVGCSQMLTEIGTQSTLLQDGRHRSLLLSFSFSSQTGVSCSTWLNMTTTQCQNLPGTISRLAQLSPGLDSKFLDKESRRGQFG